MLPWLLRLFGVWGWMWVFGSRKLVREGGQLMSIKLPKRLEIHTFGTVPKGQTALSDLKGLPENDCSGAVL